MRLATVYSCVNLLAETLAGIPLYPYRHEGTRKYYDPAHPINGFLRNPNKNTNLFNIMYASMVHCLLRGNAYWYIERNSFMQPLSARLLMPNEISVYKDDQADLHYFVAGVEVFSRDIIHLRGFTHDGLMGVSAIAFSRDTMGMGLAAEQFGGKLWANGANMTGVLSTDTNLNDKQFARLKEQWQKQQAGLDNAGGTAILEQGLKYNRISISNRDAQFIETRKFNKKEICGIFRVPPHMVADMEEATFSNIEHQDLSFVKHTMRPWVTRWELELANKLFSVSEVRTGSRSMRFDLDDLMRGDVAARGAYLKEMRYAGALNGNEIREMEDFNPAGPELDRYWMPSNMIPADRVDDFIDNQKSNSSTDAA